MYSNKRFMIALAGIAVTVVGCRTDAMVSGRRPVGAPAVPVDELIQQARTSSTTLAEPDEVDLVEELISHRRSYLQALSELQSLYDRRGQAEKYRWASREMQDALSVHTYYYLLDSEVARLTLEPRRQIPEADALFADALALAKEAGHGMPALYNRDKMVQTLRMFKRLIREYPQSDKIDDAAYYCGELHKEYFKGDDTIATYWYQRAWVWDPATPYPARFQAAVVYDYRLHNRQRALELYRAAIADEPQFKSNARWAQDRIGQLTQAGPAESARTEPVAESRRDRTRSTGQQAPPP